MEDPLELETRRRIFEYLQVHPGEHMRELGRSLDIPMGALEYHLHQLVKAGILVIRRDARFTRYFVAGGTSRQEKDVLAILRQKVPRQIAAYLMLEPGATHGALLEKFSLSPSTLSFHLKKLVTTGIVVQEKVGRENKYTVIDPELVGRVLVSHKASFFDDVVDRFASVWQGLDAGRDVGASGRAPPGGGGGVLWVLRAIVAAPLMALVAGRPRLIRGA